MPDTTIRTVLFDLDGTLIDHFRVIYRCYRHSLDQLGLEPVSFEKVKATVGGGIRTTFSRLVPEEHIDAGVRHWQAEYERIWSEDIEVLPFVPALLERLHREGYKLAVFTNKEGSYARKITAHLGWDRWLDGVVGRLDTDWVKPAAELTRHVVESVGAAPESAVMVGDSPFDVEAGKAAELRTYAVATGSHSPEQLRETAADGVFIDMAELAREVFGLDLAEPPSAE